MLSFAVILCGQQRARSWSQSKLPVKMFAFLFVFACTMSGPRGRATDTRNSTVTPILVELFTSEGCSSCPPVDALLEQMDASQPVPGAELIVLSEHVDYWDHDGWKDPYSSSLLTDRQSGYVRALGLKTPYTPQVIVDGTTELRASGSEQVIQILQKATAAPKLPVRISEVTTDPATPGVLRARIEVDGDSAKHRGDIYVAVALDHAESQVLRGENGGQHLTHVAVVQELTKVGKLEKGKNFNEDVRLKLMPGSDSKNIRIIAFVQEPGLGRVLGTASQKPQH
jgi:hypothetical protein